MQAICSHWPLISAESELRSGIKSILKTSLSSSLTHYRLTDFQLLPVRHVWGWLGSDWGIWIFYLIFWLAYFNPVLASLFAYCDWTRSLLFLVLNSEFLVPFLVINWGVLIGFEFFWCLTIICSLVMHQCERTVCSSVVSLTLTQTLALYAFAGTSCTASKSVIDCYSPVALNYMICDAGLVCCHCYLKLLAVIFNPTKLLSGPLCSSSSARILLS